MNNKYIIVTALTLIVVIAAVIVSQQRAPQTSMEKTRLFPELTGKINDVSELVIHDGQTTLTVHRVSEKWSIADADDYPALVDKVKQTVLAVSDLQVVAEKTNNPDLYKRLGVEDPDSLGATSHLLTLTADGDELATLIAGETRRSKSASSAPGLYVRIPGQQQALLVEGRLTVSTDIIQWIQTGYHQYRRRPGQQSPYTTGRQAGGNSEKRRPCRRPGIAEHPGGQGATIRVPGKPYGDRTGKHIR